MHFKKFNLHPAIELGIEKIGYKEPTPIQTKTIPLIMENRDVMGLAQTGTGKTAAFVLPLLHHLMKQPRKVLQALIIVPTRELAEQTHEAIIQLGRNTKLKSTTIYGGVNQTSQIRNLRKGPEIVVACPGRLLDLMKQREIDLSRVEVLIIDEADRMFDMGFLPNVRKILESLPARRQTLLFSATMPDDVSNLAGNILNNPVTVRIGHTAPASTVSHAIYPVEQHLKAPLLMNILDNTDTDSVLVFARTKMRTTRLAEKMKKSGFPVTSLHGDLSQSKRQEALDGFRSGKYRVLVATDIAARGIDVSQISHVINYDMPETVDAYTHRIGRTGRASKTGDAFTFVTGPDRAFVWSIESALGEKLERRIVQDFDYTIPAPAVSENSGSSRRGGRHQSQSKTFMKSRTGNARSSSSASAPAPGARKKRKDLSQYPMFMGLSKQKSRQH